MKIKHITPMIYYLRCYRRYGYCQECCEKSRFTAPYLYFRHDRAQHHVTESFEKIGVQTIDGENRLAILELMSHGDGTVQHMVFLTP